MLPGPPLPDQPLPAQPQADTQRPSSAWTSLPALCVCVCVLRVYVRVVVVVVVYVCLNDLGPALTEEVTTHPPRGVMGAYV